MIDKEIRIQLFVVNNGVITFIRKDMKKLGFQVKIVWKVVAKDDIIWDFSEVFTSKIGKCVGSEIKLQVQERQYQNTVERGRFLMLSKARSKKS